MSEEFRIKLNQDDLKKLLKSNLSVYYGETIDSNSIELLVMNIVDSIEFFLNKRNS